MRPLAPMLRKHKYGVTFYNEDTKEEISAWFVAIDYFQAQNIVDSVSVSSNWIIGDPEYIAKDWNDDFYNTKLEDAVQSISS